MSTEKKSFVKRVMDSLKGGDEKKISRFHKKTIKHIQDQIRIRETSIEELGEKVSDLSEDFDAAILNVNLDRLNSSHEKAKEYSIDYVNDLLHFRKRKTSLETEAEEKREAVKILNEVINAIGKT